MSAMVTMQVMVPQELRRRAKIAFASEGITYQKWFSLQLMQWLEERDRKEKMES